MKTIKKILILILSIGLIMSCSKPNEILVQDSINLKSQNVNQEQYQNQEREYGIDQDRYITMPETGLKVHYRIIGKGPIDVVFIPGWTNPLEIYTKQFDYFRDKARCIYIDLPGHGLSDAPEGIEYTQELMVNAIQTIVKKEGLKKFIGVGFSWSGTTLKLFEMKHPGMVNQLILLDIGIPTWPPITETYRDGQLAFWSSLTYEQKIDLLPLFINPATAPADLWDFGLQFWPDFPSWLLANMYYHYLAEENCQPYPWEIPIMVIYNVMNETKETVTNLHYPGCEIHLLGGDQHVIPWAYYETVNQLINDFIADHPGNKY